MTAKKATKSNFTKALDLIAAEMELNAQHPDPATGELVTVNLFDFPRRRMFNSICYGLERTIAVTSDSIKKAVDRLNGAVYHYNGSSDEAVRRATDWLNRLQDQLAMLQALEAEAHAAHLAYTGEAYVPVDVAKKQAAQNAKRLATDPALADAVALLKQHGKDATGTRAPGGYNSATDSDENVPL